MPPPMVVSLAPCGASLTSMPPPILVMFTSPESAFTLVIPSSKDIGPLQLARTTVSALAMISAHVLRRFIGMPSSGRTIANLGREYGRHAGIVPPNGEFDCSPFGGSEVLPLQLFHHQFIQQDRVGVAFRRLHHLAHEESSHCLLAGKILLHLFRVGCEHLVDHCFNCRRVRNLLRLLAVVDDGEVFTLLEAHIEELLELLRADLSLVQQICGQHNSSH